MRPHTPNPTAIRYANDNDTSIIDFLHPEYSGLKGSFGEIFSSVEEYEKHKEQENTYANSIKHDGE